MILNWKRKIKENLAALISYIFHSSIESTRIPIPGISNTAPFIYLGIPLPNVGCA